MPTILMVLGWRLFFYSNEGSEPVHIHASKGGAECKFWLDRELYNIEEAWSHGLSPAMRRQIRKIVFDHFDLIIREWDEYFSGRQNEQD